jgi:hypothetical protein
MLEVIRVYGQTPCLPQPLSPHLTHPPLCSPLLLPPAPTPPPLRCAARRLGLLCGGAHAAAPAAAPGQGAALAAAGPGGADPIAACSSCASSLWQALHTSRTQDSHSTDTDTDADADAVPGGVILAWGCGTCHPDDDCCDVAHPRLARVCSSWLAHCGRASLNPAAGQSRLVSPANLGTFRFPDAAAGPAAHLTIPSQTCNLTLPVSPPPPSPHPPTLACRRT